MAESLRKRSELRVKRRSFNLDFASPTQAFAKVKVRINKMLFLDYLTALKLAKGWRIVSKTYQLLEH